jgi:hypothetical protein
MDVNGANSRTVENAVTSAINAKYGSVEDWDHIISAFRQALLQIGWHMATTTFIDQSSMTSGAAKTARWCMRLDTILDFSTLSAVLVFEQVNKS